MKSALYIFAIVGGLFLTQCKSPEKASGYYSYDTQCLETDQTGNQILKVWGKGLNVQEAKKNAFRNALEEVIFEGVRNGSGGCDVKPILVRVNAREHFQNYFDSFFSDDGKYYLFVIETRDPILEKKGKNNYEDAYGFTVKVNTRALRNQLKNDKIL